MPVDNRNFIYEDLPEDPEDEMYPEDDEPDDEDEIMNNTTQQPFIPRAPWQQNNPSFGTPPSPATVWPSSRPTTSWTPPTFGSSYQPQQNQTQQQRYQQSNANRIDRRKKIIFCDLYDILIESESAVREQQTAYLSGVNNYKKYGITPRGLYDVRLKTEVWSKFSAFGPDYVFCMTNQPSKSPEEMITWGVMIKYVMFALADYLNLPHQNCRCSTRTGLSIDTLESKTEMMRSFLKSLKEKNYTKKDLIIIGINSGYQNQNNIDRVLAKESGVDYLDVNDLLVTYY